MLFLCCVKVNSAMPPFIFNLPMAITIDTFSIVQKKEPLTSFISSPTIGMQIKDQYRSRSCKSPRILFYFLHTSAGHVLGSSLMAITRSNPSEQCAGTPVVLKQVSLHVLLDPVRNRPGAAISKQLRASQGAKKRVRRPSAQLREDLESAIAAIPPAKRHQEAPRFLFVPFPDAKDIAEETHIAIDASNTSDRFLARYPMYNAGNMSMIQKELGKGFASHGMTSTKPYYEIPILHQGVVTMQHLSHSFKRDVTFRSWDWLQTLQQPNFAPRNPAKPNSTPSSPTSTSPASSSCTGPSSPARP